MKKSILIAFVMTMAAVIWILSGVLEQKSQEGASDIIMSDTSGATPPDERPDKAKEEKIPQVRVRQLTAQLMDDDIEVTGRTQASRQVVLRAEAEGRIKSLKIKKGDFVQKGQVIAMIDVRDRVAQLEQARQLLKQRDIQYKASKELAEKGFNSAVRLAEKEAELKAARAQVKLAQEQLNLTTITAPFDGIINDKMVEIGTYVSSGNEIAEIVDLTPMKITGFLTEKQIDALKTGDLANAILLNGRVVEGQVSFIASAADVSTRTFAMEMTVDNNDLSIKEGLTAKILVPFKQDNAYKISPSILSLADDGTIGVKIVSANNRVEFKSVKLLKDTPDYLWITGLPHNVRIITVGQEFVISGQRVDPVLVETNKGQDLL